MEVEEEMMKSWPEELSPIPDLLINWLKMLVQLLYISHLIKNSLYLTLLLNINKKVTNS